MVHIRSQWGTWGDWIFLTSHEGILGASLVGGGAWIIRAHSRCSPLTEARNFFEVPLHLVMHVSEIHIELDQQKDEATP